MEERNGRPKRRTIVGIIALGAVIVVGALLLYTRHEREQRLQRTRSLAADMAREAEQAMDRIDPLTEAQRAALRTYPNKEHVQVAERYGVSGIASRSDAEELTRNRRLVRVETNPYYVVRKLDYSIPYLTPSGANLLDRIGRRFQARLGDLGLPRYRFVVTSVTRSREDQQALQRVNINAAAKSSHEFGTTVDVHYQLFNYGAPPPLPDTSGIDESELRSLLTDAYGSLAERHQAALKGVLGRVLLEMQQEKMIMAIYERRQPVFHITAAQPVPAPAPRLRPASTAGTEPALIAP